jgi:hypothetical protein
LSRIDCLGGRWFDKFVAITGLEKSIFVGQGKLAFRVYSKILKNIKYNAWFCGRIR